MKERINDEKYGTHNADKLLSNEWHGPFRIIPLIGRIYVTSCVIPIIFQIVHEGESRFFCNFINI